MTIAGIFGTIALILILIFGIFSFIINKKYFLNQKLYKYIITYVGVIIVCIILGIICKEIGI